MKQITFTSTWNTDFYPPVPASKMLPEWYKNTPSYLRDKKEVIHGSITGTIKKCVPVFDAITAGYIIPTQIDVYVEQENELPYYNWVSKEVLQFHPLEQAVFHPLQNGAPYPKWLNPYAIKTPPGYSTLFIPPMHRENNFFTILPGVVDTDTWTSPVNFPFVLNDSKFEGLIPAGTPMVQVIPFKRESWEMKFGSEEELHEVNNVYAKLQTKFFDKYKNMLWHRKEYK